MLTSSTLYATMGVLSRVASLLVLPLIARHFSVEQYGLFDTYISLIALLTALSIFGQDSAVARNFYDFSDNSLRRGFISTSLCSVILLFSIISLVLYMGMPVLTANGYFTGTFEYRYLALLLFTNLLITFGEVILRVSNDLIRYATLCVANASCSVIFTLVGIKWLKADLSTFMQITAIQYALVATIAVALTRKWFVIPSEIVHNRTVMWFTLPIGATVIVGLLQPVLERVLIARGIGTNELGVYAAALKLSIAVSLPVAAFQTAITPIVMETYRQGSFSENINLMVKTILCILVCVAIVLTAFGETITSLVLGVQFRDVPSLLPPLTAGIIFQAMGSMLGVGTILSRKTHVRLWGNLLFVPVSLLLIGVLGAQFGLVGIAYAYAGGKAGLMIYDGLSAQLLHPIKWDYRGLLLICGVWLTASIALPNLRTASLLKVLSLCFTCLLIFGSFYGSLTAAQRRDLRALAWRNRS
jgi:O-antigen/teichoic acid export membrane protein